MRPFADCPAADLAAMRGVFTDIDDTLTTDGAITPDALEALHALKAAGLPVIAITGRPQGWSEPFALDWPLEAIVAENGAVALRRQQGALRIDYLQDEPTRTRNAIRLQNAARRVIAEVPGATLAQDSAGRVTDIAIDHSEFEQLSRTQIDHVVAVMQAEGMHATVSSIHINGWFGDHDKPAGARWIVGLLYGRDLDAERDDWLYIGDSTNDQAMFARHALSVGVANLMRFERELTIWPAWITRGERGAGFAEVARRLLAART